MKFNKICVIGLGYIGLPTASTFANNGVHVVGVDNNPHIVETLRKGELHIHWSQSGFNYYRLGVGR